MFPCPSANRPANKAPVCMSGDSESQLRELRESDTLQERVLQKPQRHQGRQRRSGEASETSGTYSYHTHDSNRKPHPTGLVPQFLLTNTSFSAINNKPTKHTAGKRKCNLKRQSKPKLRHDTDTGIIAPVIKIAKVNTLRALCGNADKI